MRWGPREKKMIERSSSCSITTVENSPNVYRYVYSGLSNNATLIIYLIHSSKTPSSTSRTST
jgi:hypothetical protein